MGFQFKQEGEKVEHQSDQVAHGANDKPLLERLEQMQQQLQDMRDRQEADAKAVVQWFGVAVFVFLLLVPLVLRFWLILESPKVLWPCLL